MRTPLSVLHQAKVRGGNPAEQSLSRIFGKLDHCGIWFIDGINVLLERISASEDVERARNLQRLIRDVFLEESSTPRNMKAHPGSPSIVLMTAEACGDRRDFIYESYLADVVIRLEQQEIVADPLFPNAKERYLACSIPKGRGIHVHRRELTYEFVPGEGIKFYPTYPATGTVSLFFENERQKKQIQDFKDNDVPSLYPGLSVRSFHRSSILHEYAVRRRQNEIPRRYENSTSSLDEYWTSNLRKILAELPMESIKPYGQEFSKALIPEILEPKKEWLLSDDSKSVHAVPYLGNIGIFLLNRRTGITVHKAAGDSTPYVTWEQIEKYCADATTSEESPKLCCEMKSVDSFVAFALEVCWSHEGGWYTESTKNKLQPLRVCFPSGQSNEGVIAGLRRIKKWVHRKKILHPYSTLQSDHPGCVSSPDFARHWYSTRVESITARTKGVLSRDAQILPIPIPKHRINNHLSARDFHSCWGEWYLGAWRGTENIRLVTEIVNTITSSRWQINSAITGSGVPVYEPFFQEFGESRCFGTDLSFNSMRKYLYAGAFSRARFFRYRFVMQRFYAALMTIVANPKIKVKQLWKETVRRIQAGE